MCMCNLQFTKLEFEHISSERDGLLNMSIKTTDHIEIDKMTVANTAVNE